MRYLVVSDVHANLAALEAVLGETGWDEVIFLGDAIITGPRPAGTLELLDEQPGVLLEGNHDRDPFRVDPEADPTAPHHAWTYWTRERLTDTHREVIEAFEGTRPFEADGRTLRLHHGNFSGEGLDPSFDGRLWPDSEPVVFEQLAGRFPESTVLHGHSHIQFEREVADTTFVNPGSVGAPRLGEPLACYAAVDDGEVSFGAVEYDVERTCAAMDDLPLDREFVDAWKEGYRTGTLPDRYDLRDFGPLRDGPYR